MTANFASPIRTFGWTEGFNGKFRVVTVDRCPTCQVAEAHTVQYDDGTGTGKCQVCCNVVSYVNRVTPDVPEVGSYIGFEGAHPNNLYQVLEADEAGVIVDFTGSYRAVLLENVRFHAECDNTWCIACFTYVDDGKGGWVRTPR